MLDTYVFFKRWGRAALDMPPPPVGLPSQSLKFATLFPPREAADRDVPRCTTLKMCTSESLYSLPLPIAGQNPSKTEGLGKGRGGTTQDNLAFGKKE